MEPDFDRFVAKLEDVNASFSDLKSAIEKAARSRQDATIRVLRREVDSERRAEEHRGQGREKDDRLHLLRLDQVSSTLPQRRTHESLRNLLRLRRKEEEWLMEEMREEEEGVRRMVRTEEEEAKTLAREAERDGESLKAAWEKISVEKQRIQETICEIFNSFETVEKKSANSVKMWNELRSRLKFTHSNLREASSELKRRQKEIEELRCHIAFAKDENQVVEDAKDHSENRLTQKQFEKQEVKDFQRELDAQKIGLHSQEAELLHKIASISVRKSSRVVSEKSTFANPRAISADMLGILDIITNIVAMVVH